MRAGPASIPARAPGRRGPDAERGPRLSPDVRLAASVGVLVALWGCLGIPARSTYGAQVSVDEPQYLMTALSIAHDGDLDVANQIDEGQFRAFHAPDLNPQTRPLDASGRRISPHDPLLPAILAGPTRLLGWQGARLTLAAFAGFTAAATVLLARRRFRAGALATTVVVVGAFGGGPLAAYATQVYPEMPAALATTIAIAAVTGSAGRHRIGPTTTDPTSTGSAGPHTATTGPTTTGPTGTGSPGPHTARTGPTTTGSRAAGSAGTGSAGTGPSLGRPLTPHQLATVGLCVIALPWLSIKYAPVALALAGALAVRLVRERQIRLLAVAAVGASFATVVYAAVHRSVYGGWTAYASGDHFVSGEFGVVGFDPDYVGRSVRLTGLLLDRTFGLGPWAPLWLLAVPAVATVVSTRRGPERFLVATSLAVVVAGWATATWVALTMQGWWSPGRQIVVVLPTLAALIARFVSIGGRPRMVGAAAAGLAGAISWAWLAVEASTGGPVLVVDFADTSNPWMAAWSRLFPDLWELTGRPWLLLGIWSSVAVLAVRATWSGTGRTRNIAVAVATVLVMVPVGLGQGLDRPDDGALVRAAGTGE